MLASCSRINTYLTLGIRDAKTYVRTLLAMYEGSKLLAATDNHKKQAATILELTIKYGGKILTEMGLLEDFKTVQRVLNDVSAPALNYVTDLQSEIGKAFKF
jgi:hypothetical protein